MANTERVLRDLKIRRSKANDAAEGELRNANEKYYQEGIAQGIEIAEMIVKKIEREEREEAKGGR